MTIVGRLGATAALAALLGLVTLGPRGNEPRTLYVVAGDGGGLSPAPDPGEPPLDVLLDQIADRLRGDFGLPLPSRVTTYVYGSSGDFARGLVTHASLAPGRAASLAEFAIGVAVPGAILLRRPQRGVAAEWPRLLAHELTHVAQIQLAGGEDGPAQWIVEGTAEWVAFRVLDHLQPGAWRAQQAAARAAAEAYVQTAGGLDLEELSSARGFLARHRRAGTLRTYRLAFDLIDDLVGRHGFSALVTYFRSFRDAPDAQRNFVGAFDMSTEQFERATAGRLMVGPAASGLRAAACQADEPGACSPNHTGARSDDPG